MNKTFVAGGCSFTFGHELSDDDQGKTPAKKHGRIGCLMFFQQQIRAPYPAQEIQALFQEF